VTLTSTVTSSKVRRSVLLLLPFLTDGPVPVAGPVWRRKHDSYNPLLYNLFDIALVKSFCLFVTLYILVTIARSKLIFNIFRITCFSLLPGYMYNHSVSLVLTSHQKRIALKNMNKLRAATRRRRRGSRSSEETDRALDPGIPSRPTWAT
ncbi:hypothetical protein ALC60_12433, partial [Trachymyrmex zeteki]